MMNVDEQCLRIGHEFVREADLNDDYACWMCHAVRAFIPARPIDKVLD